MEQLPAGAVRVGTDVVVPSSSVRDLGSCLEAYVSMNYHRHPYASCPQPTGVRSTLCANQSIPAACCGASFVAIRQWQCDIGWTISLNVLSAAGGNEQESHNGLKGARGFDYIAPSCVSCIGLECQNTPHSMWRLLSTNVSRVRRQAICLMNFACRMKLHDAV
jgi:hypothetical protein